MKLAFLIFKYFPFGGVQRDMLRIAKDCVALGHSVKIYTGEWHGEVPADIELEILPSKGWLNHQRHRSLIKAMHARIAKCPVDAVVGFNRMAGLDVYYAADPCFIARAYEEKGWLYRLSSRFRFFRDCENAVFSVNSKTHILLLTERDKKEFTRWYHTPEPRLIVLPPNIELKRFKNKDKESSRRYVRQQFNLPADAKVILTVGSAYIRKGVDRVIQAIADLPDSIKRNTWLVAVGEYESNNRFRRDVVKLGVADQVIAAGGRPDVADLMVGSDIFAHPARSELAGLVITEALTAGLPVLVTANCGYAQHVANAEAGIVTEVPFKQQIFNSQLFNMLTSPHTEIWTKNGITYTNRLACKKDTDIEAKIITSIIDRNAHQAHSSNRPLVRIDA